MWDEFVAWNNSIKTEMTEVSRLLSLRLSDEPAELIRDLEEIEVWNGRVGSLLAQADSWLDRYTFIAMPSREDGKLEADRRAQLDSETAPIRLLRDTLEHFSDSIRQRLILGESILSYQKIYAEKRIMGTEKIY